MTILGFQDQNPQPQVQAAATQSNHGVPQALVLVPAATQSKLLELQDPLQAVDTQSSHTLELLTLDPHQEEAGVPLLQDTQSRPLDPPTLEQELEVSVNPAHPRTTVVKQLEL